MLAGILTTAAFIPQVLKCWRSRSTADISLIMFSTMTTGVFLWLVYGLFLNSPSLIVANSVTLILSGAILFMKVRFG
ncbi:SemiSWEET transporter [Rhodospirillaceae bacterium KN72]|uniref:SemiSWEET transporter n=2 Tax=Pacificispira spongiicola TaxID=2729598 RepID=A0A7Y0E2R0_9PROT|nr:SemiSWEET transporter [Pacificispira spongiicola]